VPEKEKRKTPPKMIGRTKKQNRMASIAAPSGKCERAKRGGSNEEFEEKGCIHEKRFLIRSKSALYAGRRAGGKKGWSAMDEKAEKKKEGKEQREGS